MSEGEEVVSEPSEPVETAEVVSEPAVIPTVVVGKKKVKKSVEPVEIVESVEKEPVSEEKPVIEEKPSASDLPKQQQRAPRAHKPKQVLTEKPPPILAAPPPKAKKVRVKSETRQEEPPMPEETEPVSSRRLLTDLNDFSDRIQELHRMNEQHRKNVYRELIGAMV